MPEPARRLEVLLVLAATVVLVAVACLVSPAFFEGTDWLQLHLPSRVYAAEALASGRLPLWNPHMGLGRPFLADTENAVLYPPNLVHVLVDPATALLLLTLAHFALGLVGMLALGRAVGGRPWTAWLAAACFLWSGPIVARLSAGLVPYAHAACYLPLLFFLALRLQDAFSFRRLGALAAALALQLVCGHPQMAWVTWLGLGAFLVGRSLPSRASWRPFLQGIGGFGAALLLAFALAAPMLLPFAELVSQGNRSEPSLEFAAAATLEWWQWTSLALPDGGRRVFIWEANLYAGLLALVAGAAGLTRLRDANVRGFAAAGLAGALVACGTRTPAFAVLYHLVPGLSSFHLHARAAQLTVFALIVGAMLFLSTESTRRRTAGLLSLGVALAVAGPLAFRAFAPSPDAAAEPISLARLALPLGVATLAGLVVHLPGGRGAALARLGLAALVLAELGLSLRPMRQAWTLPVVRQGERPLFEGLVQAGLFGERGVPPRVAVPPWSIRQNSGLLYGWSNVAGYNALSLDRTWVTLHETLGLEPPRDENTYPSRRIYDVGPFPWDTMNLVAGWTALTPGARTARDPGVMWQPPPGRPVLRRATDPRAYLVASTETVDDWRAAVEQMARGHDVHRSALVETGLSLGRARVDAGRAEIVSFAPERIEIEVDARGPALLVVAEAWYPGWSATVAGAPAPCLPANAWMRAVPVPAGTHRVVLRYRSRWLLPGAALFFLTVAGLLVAARRERRASDRAEGPPGDQGEPGHHDEKPDPQENGVAL